MSQEVSLQVASNVYSLAQSVLSFSAAAKQAVADGWDSSKDLPFLLAEAVKDLVPALAKLEPAIAEFGSDKQGSILAVLVALAKSGLLPE